MIIICLICMAKYSRQRQRKPLMRQPAKNLSGVKGRASRTGRKGPVMTLIEESKETAVKETVIPNTDPVSQKGAFMIVFNGQFFGQALTNRLARLAQVFDAEEEYEVRVEVKEINNLL
ncbi:MAG: hypothetical protein DDT19_00810 [Syntrophomonadaceae bacterium]|nr:hypothetical protein [Bacillota bacterium]